MGRHELYELFAKKESGEITESELIRLNSILESEANKAIYTQLKRAIEDEQFYPQMKFDYKKNKEFIITEIRKYEPYFTMGKEKKSQRDIKLKNWIFRVAAVAIIVIAVGGAMYLLQTKIDNTVPSVAFNNYTTKPGKNMKLTLTDGSFIQLNGGSSIRFAEHFSETKREVWIEGEAYCEIAKDKSRPFIVNLGDYKVEVLGTTFDVDAYRQDKLLSVALVEGHVKVYKNRENSISLNPGKVLRIDKETNKYKQLKLNVDKSTGWKDKIFVFNNTPLAYVLKKLERRYGLTFDTGDIDISKFRINTKFNNDPLSSIIDAIEYGTGLKLEVKENNHIKLSE